MAIQNDSLLAFTQKLISTNSVTGYEQNVVNVLVDEMQQLGFDRVWIDECGSAIGLIQGWRKGPTILLDGHCDTVDANAADWSVDPWGGITKDGRLFGRGAADMKGSLAAMIYAAAAVDRSSLAGQVVISATVAEETIEGGTLEYVMTQVKPEYVVIGEATRLNLNRGGRGRAEIHVTTKGRPAHSSSPQEGHCAVTDMLRLVRAFSELPVPEDVFLGEGSLVLTDIISAPYPGRSVIPYRCDVTYDRRLLPGDTKESVLRALLQVPSDKVEYSLSLAINSERTYTGKQMGGEKFFPAWVFPEEHPFVQMSLAGLRKAGLSPLIGAYKFCTNAAYSAGVAGVPTVGFGIGREEDAHIIDESIFVNDLLTAAGGYQGIIEAVCST